MAILLPQQTYTLAANVGRSYYENLAGGINASVTVNNVGPASINLVITRVDAPTVTYAIPAGNGLTITVNGLLVAGLLTTALGAATGTIQVAIAEF